MIVNPATMSLLGLYRYDNTIFSSMEYPTGFQTSDKSTFINNLLMEVAELEVLYTDPSFMKFAIENWSKKEVYTWNRVYAAANAEYNPIENYDRKEQSTDTTEATRQHSGTDTITNSGKDTTQMSGTDSSTNTGTQTVMNSGSDATTHQTAAFNSTSLVDSGQDSTAYGHAQNISNSDSVSVTHGQKQELTHGHTEATQHGEKIEDDTETTRESRIHGNIGVTTSQQMLEQEMLIAPKLNVINYMIDSFKNRFCILVY